MELVYGYTILVSGVGELSSKSSTLDCAVKLKPSVSYKYDHVSYTHNDMLNYFLV